jgi:hypothetical protein
MKEDVFRAWVAMSPGQEPHRNSEGRPEGQAQVAAVSVGERDAPP